MVDLANLSEQLYATTPAPNSHSTALDARELQHSPRRAGLIATDVLERGGTAGILGNSNSNTASPYARRRLDEHEPREEEAIGAAATRISVAADTQPRLFMWGLTGYRLLPEEASAAVPSVSAAVLSVSPPSAERTASVAAPRTAQVPTEVAVPPPHVVSAVACSPYVAVALTSEGLMLSWGRARQAAVPLLGDNHPVDRGIPTALALPVRMRAVAMGAYHVLALADNGHAYVWGSNSNGQLGLGLPDLVPHVAAPTLLAALKDRPLGQLAAGVSHSLALARDGRVYAFGLGQSGQLGLGNTSSCSTPNEIKAFKAPVMCVSAAMNHSACIAAGEVYVWGHTVGGGGAARVVSQPQLVPVNRELQLCQVACGHSHVALLSDLGTVYTWGDGLIGHEGSEHEAEPRVVSLLQDYSVVHVSCGGRHTAVLTDERRLLTFGRDPFGQLGLERGEQARPQLVERLPGAVVSVCASENSTAAVAVAASPRFALLSEFFASGMLLCCVCVFFFLSPV